MSAEGQTKAAFFGGLQKNEVIGYFDDMAADARQREEELKKKISALEESRRLLEQRVEEFSGKIHLLEEKLQHQIEEQKKMEFDFSEIVFEKQSMVSHQEQLLKEREEELARCRREIWDYIEEQKRLKGQISGLQAKSEKYDAVKESLEELKMSAELEAAEIVEEAEAQAMDAISAVDEVTQQVKRLKEETEKLSDTPQEQNRLEMFYASMEQVLEQLGRTKARFFAKHMVQEPVRQEERVPEDTIVFDKEMFRRERERSKEALNYMEKLRRAKEALEED